MRPPPPAPAPEAAKQIQPWWLAIAAAAAISLGIAGPPVWHWLDRVDRVRAVLPASPDVTAWPDQFRSALQAASTAIHSRDTILAGVAQLGRLYHANGFMAEAESCWRTLQREDPTEARWYYYQADLRRTASDQPALEILLSQTVELAPDYAPAWLQLAELAFKSARFDTAEDRYRTRLRLLPEDPYARLGLARIALQRGQQEAARSMLEDLVRGSPEFSPAHNLYAEILATAGETAKAQEHRWQGRETGRFREAPDPWLNDLIADCYDPRRLRVLGTIAYQTKELEQAQVLIERAIALAPKDPEGYELLGDLQLNTGRPDPARVAYEKARSLRVGGEPSTILYVNLSEAYRQLDRPEESLAVLQEGLARVPEAFELFNSVGLTLSAVGQHEDAVTAYREALKRHPGDANTNFNLGVSLLELNRRDEAQAAFTQALTLQPTFPQALFFLGRLEMDAGDLAAAGRYLVPLYQSHPEQVPVRKLVAQWHLGSGLAAARQGDAAGAELHYREGLLVDPDTAGLHANLGVLCLTQGRVAEAVAPLESFRRLEPGNPQGALLLGQAYTRMGRQGEARAVLSEAEQLAMHAGRDDLATRSREILRQLPPDPDSPR